MAAEAILYQTRYKDNMQGFSPWNFIKSWHCFIDMNKKTTVTLPTCIEGTEQVYIMTGFFILQKRVSGEF